MKERVVVDRVPSRSHVPIRSFPTHFVLLFTPPRFAIAIPYHCHHHHCVHFTQFWLLMASVQVNRDLAPPELQPTDVYGSTGPVALRIATGGAGQSGLLRALALAFIEE